MIEKINVVEEDTATPGLMEIRPGETLLEDPVAQDTVSQESFIPE